MFLPKAVSASRPLSPANFQVPWVSLSATHGGKRRNVVLVSHDYYMIIVLEILFAIWLVHELFATVIGVALMLVGLAAQVSGWVLCVLSKFIEIFCCLWKTAFHGEA
ncbi:hypothetical protein BH09VER1_BH09VER1_53060 [soil metagenome]